MASAALELILRLKDEASRGLESVRASLGAVGEAAAGAAGVGLAAFGVAAGATVAGLLDISGQAADARNALQGLADVDYSSLLSDASLISARYGVDTQETVRATRALMDEFGVTSQQATDMLVAGFERGLNTSDDFLDTIGEYSNLFAEGGASAEEFFSLMQTGMRSGVLGTDKAADAFKEFGIRIQDGSDATAEALAALGLGTLTDDLSSGATNAAGAFGRVQQALRGVRDPLVQAQLGVALFGTQFEDLGASAVLGIDLAAASMADLTATADQGRNSFASLGEILPRLWGAFTAELLPANDALLALANQYAPATFAAIGRLSDVVDSLAYAFSGAALEFDKISFYTTAFAAGWASAQPYLDTARASLDTLGGTLSGALRAGLDWLTGTALPALQQGWATVQPGVDAARGALEGLAPIFQPLLDAVQPVIDGFGEGGVAGALAALPAALMGALTELGNLRTELTALALEGIGGLLTQAAELPALTEGLAALGVPGPAIEAITGTLGNLGGILQAVGGWVRSVGEWFTTSLMPALAAAGSGFAEMLAPHLQWLGEFVEARLMPILSWFGAFIGDNLPGVIGVLSPLLTGLVDVGLSALELVMGAIATTWETVLRPVFEQWGQWFEQLTGGWDNLAAGAERLAGTLAGIAQAIRDIASGNVDFGQIFSGLQSLLGGNINIPGFAGGVEGFAGGLAIVGERGPELVRLPGGSDVIPFGGGGFGGGGGGGGTVINVSVSVGGSVTAERDLAESIRRQLIEIGRANISAGIP